MGVATTNLGVFAQKKLKVTPFKNFLDQPLNLQLSATFLSIIRGLKYGMLLIEIMIVLREFKLLVQSRCLKVEEVGKEVI